MAISFKSTQFGRYLLTDRLAVGGMAEIFRAKVFGAMGFEKQVVIKRTLPQFSDDASFLRMFITEAKLVCHLQHPNIVQVNDLGEIDGQYYIAMEYIPGLDARRVWRTLASRKQRLPGVLAAFVVAEVLKALDYAHRAVGPDNLLLGVVHRDVSPSNVLISFRGDVKIGDFGIALVQQESKTQGGILKGKYGYMSPEQVTGHRVDYRSDIFSSGVVLVELLLGRRLFLGKNDFDTLDRVMNVRLDVFETHEDRLPAPVVPMLRRALQRDPDARYQSARDFHDDLMEFVFSQDRRITSEALAAFLSHHVVPYLGPDAGVSAEGSSPSSDSAPRAGALVSPVVPHGIVPRDTDLTPKPKSEAEIARDVAVEQVAKRQFPLRAHTELCPTVDNAGGGRRPEPWRATPERRDPGAHDTGRGAQLTTLLDAPAIDGARQAEKQQSDGLTTPMPADDSQQQVARPALSPDDTQPDVSRAQPTRGQRFMVAVTSATAENRAVGARAQPSRLPDHPLWDNNVVDPGGKVGNNGGALSVSDDASDPIESDQLELDLEALRDWPPYDREGSGMDAATSSDDEPSEGSAMLRARLYTAAEQVERDSAADFEGTLSSRTLAKVLYRFGVVGESGLLTLTGPDRADGSQTSGDDNNQTLLWLQGLLAETGHAVADPSDTPAAHRTCEIHFDQGQPHLVAVDRSEEGLVVHLLCNGELEADSAERALRRRPHRALMAALIDAGLLSPLQISRRVTSFVLQRVLEAFGWREGSFAFYRKKQPSQEAFPTAMTWPELIKEGVHLMSSQSLQDYFGPIAARQVSRSARPPAPLPVFAPDGLLTRLYARTETRQPVGSLLEPPAAEADELQMQRALYLLLECEIVTVE